VASDAAKTEVDRSPARRSARDQWASSAVSSFQKACHHWKDDPARSLELLRRVLEGVAHAVRIDRDDSFASHERAELNRQLLGELLPKIRPHLPKGLWPIVESIKKLGDLHHHNQGEAIEASPRQALGMLQQCAALLEWLYDDVIGAPRPPELTAAIRALDNRGTGSVVSMVVEPRPVAPRRAHGARWRWLALVAAALVTAGVWFLFITVRSPFRNLSQPERGWIEAYQSALEARDPDRLVALHVIPTGRFFESRGLDAPTLRKLFKGWFDYAGPAHRTGFDQCVTVYAGSDGVRALTCDTYIDPPIPGKASRLATCLAFNSEGKVVTRTELSRVPSCPPP
jgi:hypothetical protein